MKSRKPHLAMATAIWISCLVSPFQSPAQNAPGAISGSVVDAAGHPVNHAHVSANLARGATAAETDTDANGRFTLSNLAPGSYQVTVTASGFDAKTASAVAAAGASSALDLVLNAAGSAQAPTAPSAPAPNAPSLGDLGFSPQQTQANPQLQATLERHTEMLRIHQRLGLITVIPMAAAVITGPQVKAKGRNGQTIKEPTQANLDLHAALGGATTALYFSSAYFAMFAPRISDNPKHGGIRWHEALAFIHGPGMVLTPVLGYMAYKQENSGEKVHGLASAHAPVAYITAASYGAAIIAVSWPIHVKFWERK